MKYKVGDKVKIKSIDWYNTNKDKDGYIFGLGAVCFCPNMIELCGEEVVINKVHKAKDNYGFIYDLNESIFGITEAMIERKVGRIDEDNTKKEIEGMKEDMISLISELPLN